MVVILLLVVVVIVDVEVVVVVVSVFERGEVKTGGSFLLLFSFFGGVFSKSSSK